MEDWTSKNKGLYVLKSGNLWRRKDTAKSRSLRLMYAGVHGALQSTHGRWRSRATPTPERRNIRRSGMDAQVTRSRSHAEARSITVTTTITMIITAAVCA